MQGHGSQESKQAAAATQRGSVQSAQESHEESDLASTMYWIDYPMPFLSFYYDTFPAVDDGLAGAAEVASLTRPSQRERLQIALHCGPSCTVAADSPFELREHPGDRLRSPGQNSESVESEEDTS